MIEEINQVFVNKMQKLLGEDASKFFDALEKPSSRAITLNTLRMNKEDFEKEADFELTPISNINNGYCVNDLKFGPHKLNHLGVIYSQEPSSMYPVQLLDIQKGDIVLDLCAAPGGKSIQILEKLQESGLLVSNEIVYNRAKILYENIHKMGFKNTTITCNRPQDFEKTNLLFDKILVDAPCGGEGMFRKNNFDFNAYNSQSIETNAVRQLSILNSVKDLLKPGGTLVYSTCTYDIRENEEVVAKFLKENSDFKIVKCPEFEKVAKSGIKIESYNTDYSLRRYPHEFDGEGQFMAKLIKKMNKNFDQDNQKDHDDFAAMGFSIVYRKEREQINKELKSICDLSQFIIAKRNNSLFVLPEILLNYENLNVLSSGTLLGNIDRSGIKIAHEFYHTYGDIFTNKIELNNNQLLDYLKGYEINLDDAQSSGICAVHHDGIPVGGGKITDKKLKNYYPKNLRNK